MKTIQSALSSGLIAALAFTGAARAADTAPASPNAPAAPAAAVRTEITTMDTWEATCSYDKDNRKIGCNAVLRVKQEPTPASGKEPAHPGRIFMLWALSKANDGTLYSSFETLTGVRVQPGLQLKLDAAPPRIIPFDSCGTSSCVAIAKMEPDFVKQAGGASQIQATVLGTDGKAYTATFAPKGIDRAILAVR